MNSQLSREIYSQFISGSAINKQNYNPQSNQLEDNPLFLELCSEFDGINGYQMMYANLGYEIVLCADYAYLCDLDRNEDEISKYAIPIHCLLTLLAQSAMRLNYHSTLLTTPNAGASEALCQQAEQDESVREILNACGCPKSFWEEEKNILIKRGIAFLNAKQNLVLTNTGNAFLQHIFDTATGEAATHSPY